MASGTHRFGTGRSQLRRIVAEYVDLIGPGGLTLYVASQDLLVITDFNSLLVLQEAEKYVKPHKLRAVSEFTNFRRELPGAHILSADSEDPPTDIRYKSLICDRSIYVMDLVALSDAQNAASLELRYRLDKRYKSRRDPNPITTLSNINGTQVLVGDSYYNTLLAPDKIRLFSGVYDNFSEPTKAWKDLPLEEKGVFFVADKTFYGLVMPHAKTNVSARDGSDHDK